VLAASPFKPDHARYITPSIAYQPEGGFSQDFLQQIGLADLYLDTSFTYKAGLPLPSSSALDLQDLGLPSDTVIACPLIDCYAGYVGTLGYSSADGQSHFEQASSRLAVVAGTSVSPMQLFVW
jgi:ribulose kinase